MVCRFNRLWPNLLDLLSWISSEWYPLLDGEAITCPYSKGFFVVVFESTNDRVKVFNVGSWFWGIARLSMQLLTPDFDPSMDDIYSSLVWVRRPYFPLHLWGMSLFNILAMALASSSVEAQIPGHPSPPSLESM
jgi:hypothetical protein